MPHRSDRARMHGTAWPDPEDQPPESGRILCEHLPVFGSDPWLVPRTSSREPDPINRARASDKQGAAVFSPGHIRRGPAGLDRAEQRAVRRNDADPAGASAEEVAMLSDSRRNRSQNVQQTVQPGRTQRRGQKSHSGSYIESRIETRPSLADFSTSCQSKDDDDRTDAEQSPGVVTTPHRNCNKW
jgi:hypothetical protein